MNFARLGAKYRVRSKLIAQRVVARGKRRFVMRASGISGPTFWVGMNAYFLIRDNDGLRGRYLAYWGIVSLLGSMVFGFLFSLMIWARYQRLAKSE